MDTDTTIDQNYERTLIDIVRVLPSSRVAQLVDFARFLAAQMLSEKLMQEEDIAEVEANNARWDALLATDKAQAVLKKLADEALAEHRAGKTKAMTFNDDGRILPE